MGLAEKMIDIYASKLMIETQLFVNIFEPERKPEIALNFHQTFCTSRCSSSRIQFSHMCDCHMFNMCYLQCRDKLEQGTTPQKFIKSDKADDKESNILTVSSIKRKEVGNI